MAWSDSTQMGGSFNGGTIEFGQATLVDGTVEVSTKMSKVFAASAVMIEDPVAAPAFYCDLTITSSAVTFACGNLNATFSYILIGQ